MGKSWKNAGKVENAMKKGKIFTKLAKEIAVAAKLGGGDPGMNARLRMAIDAAKAESCPNDTIERAIKKGTGQLDDGKIIEELTYEGYGPHGVGVIVQCQTDNKHRTAPEMRSVFKKHGGNLGETNSVTWMFDHVSFIEATKSGTFDPEEEAIEAGADNVEKVEDMYEFIASVPSTDSVQKTLTARGWKVGTVYLGYKAKNITTLSPEQTKEVEEFLQAVDDLDDSQRLFATI